MADLYEVQEWADLPDKTTPISAERLTHIEDGIYSNSEAIQANADAIAELSESVGSSSGTADVPIATEDTAGIVKPDGTTITITEDGTISATASSDSTDYDDVYASKEIYADTYVSMGRMSGSTVGSYSFAFGGNCIATNTHSHAEGSNTVASAIGSHAEGSGTTASGDYSFAENYDTTASGYGSHAEGYTTEASGQYSHAEDYKTIASGSYSHAEGNSTEASGQESHAEGTSAKASAFCSHAEGYQTEASGYYAHAEGYQTVASSYCDHAEGSNTTASNYSHAEGRGTTASNFSHAEGMGTTASNYSHAEGVATKASGTCSHAEGCTTTASGDYQHVQGKYSVEDTGAAMIIGGGTSSSDLLNIFTVDWDGNLTITGSLTAGSTLLTADDDLDSLTSNGDYEISADAIPANVPDEYATYAGSLKVKALSNIGYVTQELWGLGEVEVTGIWVRCYYNEAWSDWKQTSLS